MPNKHRKETVDQLLRRYASEETYSFSEVDKIEVNTKGLENWTPLHMAISRCATSGPEAMDDVATLLEAGADVNAASYIGLTPLHVAASQGNLEACKLLVGRGANIHIKSQYGETAISAATAGGHTDVVEYLRKMVARE